MYSASLPLKLFPLEIVPEQGAANYRLFVPPRRELQLRHALLVPPGSLLGGTISFWGVFFVI